MISKNKIILSMLENHLNKKVLLIFKKLISIFFKFITPVFKILELVKDAAAGLNNTVNFFLLFYFQIVFFVNIL